MSEPGPRRVGQPPGDDGRPQIHWITNLAAPYRHPVWSALAQDSDLRVGLLADNEPNRRWTGDLPQGVRRLPMHALGLHSGRASLYLLWRLALSGNPSVVILPGWELPAAWQLLAEAKLRRIRTVAFYESTSGSHRFSNGPVAWARRRFFRSVDAVVTVGEASQRAMLSFGVPGGRVVSTYNAVDVAGIRSASSTSAHTAAHRKERFVYLGQLIHRKNVDGLLDSLALMPESTTLVIAGEGPEEAALQARARELGVAGRVEFRGYVPYAEVPAVLAEASTLVLPSRSEVYGLVVVEALAAGLQVVVTENSGVFPDVQDLAGVFGADSSAPSLRDAMLLSVAAWSGPIEQPAVLARTPEAMAKDVLRACDVARSSR